MYMIYKAEPRWGAGDPRRATSQHRGVTRYLCPVVHTCISVRVDVVYLCID